jgi:hypothetical protein
MAFPAQYLHQALMVVAVKMRAARLEGSHKFLSGLQERLFRSVRSVTVESPSLSRRLSVRPDAEIDDWVIALADRGARLHFEKGVEKRPWREIIREKLSRGEPPVRPRLAKATRIEIDGAVIGLLSEWTERPASPESGELAAVGWDIVYKQRRFDYVDEAYSVREASERLCLVPSARKSCALATSGPSTGTFSRVRGKRWAERANSLPMAGRCLTRACFPTKRESCLRRQVRPGSSGGWEHLPTCG